VCVAGLCLCWLRSWASGPADGPEALAYVPAAGTWTWVANFQVITLVPGLLLILAWALRKQTDVARTESKSKESPSDGAFLNALFEGSPAGYAKTYLLHRRTLREIDPEQVQRLATLRQSTGAVSMWRRHLRTLVLCGTLLCAQVLNKLLFKMLLGSVGPYAHFLSVTTNLMYLAFFGTVFRARLRSGTASKRVLDFAISRLDLFAGMGMCEAIAFALIPWATARLPGAWLPILGQSLLPFTLLVRRLLLNQRSSTLQLAGVALVIAGVVANVVPQLLQGSSATGGSSDAEVLLPASILCVAYGFLAISFTFKDLAFRACHAKTTQPLDVFLVDALSSLFQGLVLNWLWPASFEFLTSLPAGLYLRQACSTFLGMTHAEMPWLLLLYWAFNCAYRVVQLRVVQELSSLAVLLTNVLTVPLSSLVFCLPLPLLTASTFSPCLVLSLLIIGLGLLVFNGKQLYDQLCPAPKPSEEEPDSDDDSDSNSSE